MNEHGKGSAPSTSLQDARCKSLPRWARDKFIVDGWRSRGIVCRKRYYIGRFRVPHFVSNLWSRHSGYYGSGATFATSWAGIAVHGLRVVSDASEGAS